MENILTSATRGRKRKGRRWRRRWRGKSRLL